MPANHQVARRYATALFELSSGGTEKQFDVPKLLKIREELNSAVEVFWTNKELRQFFLNPVISVEDKLDALQSVEAQFVETGKFLTLLVENNRLHVLREIVSEFSHLVENVSGEIEVELITATQPTQKAKEEISLMLSNLWKRKINLKLSVNEKIIGGFVAKAPGRILDASVKNQLDNLRQMVSERTVA